MTEKGAARPRAAEGSDTFTPRYRQGCQNLCRADEFELDVEPLGVKLNEGVVGCIRRAAYAIAHDNHAITAIDCRKNRGEDAHVRL